MVWYLSIWVWLGAELVHGPHSDGWAPRAQPSYEICNERREHLESQWVPFLIEQGIADYAEVKCTTYDYPKKEEK